jgi:transposase-like protein
MTEQKAIEVLRKALEFYEETYEFTTDARIELTEYMDALRVGIVALNTRQIQNNIVDSLVKKTKGMDTNSYEYRKIQYAINLIERCEVDHD